jgi:hypothetical protein
MANWKDRPPFGWTLGCIAVAVWGSRYPSPSYLATELSNLAAPFVLIWIAGLIWPRFVPAGLKEFCWKVGGGALLASFAAQLFPTTSILVTVFSILAVLTVAPFLLGRLF